ncbi:MAG: T9SS type A sorting domain-containing protein [Candidatus Tenebribacter davisii]|nr:T9SS type A sorting domain-containing protein [Candidatus Tenebribacter davisii]
MTRMGKLSMVIFFLIHVSLLFAQNSTWYQTYNPFADPDRISETYYIHYVWTLPNNNFQVVGSLYCQEWCFDDYFDVFYGFTMVLDDNGNMVNFSQKYWFDIDITKIPDIGYARTAGFDISGTGLNKLLNNEFNPISSFGAWNTQFYSVNYLESDNSILLSGRPYSGDFFLQKFDLELNQIWQFYYDLPHFIETVISDNGYTILGLNSLTTIDNLKLLHIDSNGEILWEQELDYFSPEVAVFDRVSFISTADNGYLIGGRIHYAGSPGYNGFALKTYPDGSLQWLNIYEDYYSINGFIENENGYILWDTEGTCHMLSIDLQGELLWIHNFDFSDYNEIHTVTKLSNGYLISGQPIGSNCYFARIDNEGQVSIQNDLIITTILTNHPNPFNPSTTIEFSIQNDSEVELTIYNIKGQKVKTIANDLFEKGIYSILWSGDDYNGKLVSSGIYFYKLKVNGKTKAVKKCLLLK